MLRSGSVQAAQHRGTSVKTTWCLRLHLYPESAGTRADPSYNAPPFLSEKNFAVPTYKSILQGAPRQISMTYYKAGKHQTQVEQHFRVRALLQSADHKFNIMNLIKRNAALIHSPILPCSTLQIFAL